MVIPGKLLSKAPMSANNRKQPQPNFVHLYFKCVGLYHFRRQTVMKHVPPKYGKLETEMTV